MLWLSWQPKLMHWHTSGLMPFKKIYKVFHSFLYPQKKISVINQSDELAHKSDGVGFYSAITYCIIHKIYHLTGLLLKKSPKATTKFKHTRIGVNWTVQGVCSPWPRPCPAAALPPGSGDFLFLPASAQWEKEHSLSLKSAVQKCTLSKYRSPVSACYNRTTCVPKTQ